MPRLRLIHWNADEAMERSARLSALGYEVVGDVMDAPALIKSLRRDPPSAVVIDLTRLPAHGREMARSIRLSKTTRPLPLVFVGGEPEKVARVRELLPDAAFSSWNGVGTAIETSLRNPPAEPVVPGYHPGAYTDRPAAVKLGIKHGMSVGVIGAPKEFAKLVSEAGIDRVKLRPGAKGECELIILFVRSTEEFDRAFGAVTRRDFQALWIAWPKQASGVKTDLTQNNVRDTARASGLIDSKICGIDATWSALKFTRRKERI
jgi:DNA-binding NarL/FixJ family response regulator